MLKKGYYFSPSAFETQFCSLAHLDEILVKQPQRVEQGQLIGLSGQTGNATGPHVHYEMLIKGEQIDPFAYTNEQIIRYANGKKM